MKTEDKQLQKKIADYTRFFMTLMIVNTYAYLGILIHYYLKPIDNGEWLIPVLAASLIGSGFTLRLLRKWKTSPDNQMD